MTSDEKGNFNEVFIRELLEADGPLELRDTLTVYNGNGNRVLEIPQSGPVVFDNARVDSRWDIRTRKAFIARYYSAGGPFSDDTLVSVAEFGATGPGGASIRGVSSQTDMLRVNTSNNSVEIPNGTLQTTGGGPNGTGAVEFGQGSRLYENSSGEVVVEDANGNTTTLS